MKYRFLHIILLLVSVAIGVSSCVDELLYQTGDIPEGESQITATVDFPSFESSELGTRAAGNSYDKIRNLCVLIYDEAGTTLMESHYYDYSDAPINSSATYDDHRDLKFTLANGKYRIYAVANMGNLAATNKDGVKTVDALKAIRLTWVETKADGTIGPNDQMLGYFTAAGSSSDATDPSVVTINRRAMHLEAWLVRAASKVTVAYDGSQLYEGVTVYIQSLTIKDIPKECTLGEPNTPTDVNQLITDGGMIDYNPNNVPFGESYPAFVSQASPYFPKTEVTENGETIEHPDPDSHSHTNQNSLFFYENNQGVGDDKKQEIEDEETGKLVFDHKDSKPYGTYIEVYAYYESTNPARPGVGNVIYRFMLGKNITTNYDAERNHHFKLTLKLRGFANDYDWHIDLEKFLVVPDAHVVDYQGYFFTPVWSIHNLGQNFSQDNDIMVESYQKNLDTGEKEFLPITIKYGPVGATDEQFTTTGPDWLIVETEDELLTDPTKPDNKDWNPQQKVKFRYKSEITETFTVNDKFNGAKPVSGPYNLAGSSANAADDTANTYIVTAQGEYIFPLVYGNARSGGKDNKSSYTGFGDSPGVEPTDRIPASGNNIPEQPATSGESGTINTLRNYKNEGISSPYILTDIYTNKNQSIPTNISASLVWEDQNPFVTGIEYVPSAYGGKGGIKFSVGALTGGGANAVIALKDPSGTIMWSWQIWATYQGFVNDMDLNVVSPNIGSFNIMPVNLGWCSGGNDHILYWERHECDVKISNTAGFSRIITIIQEPHLAVPAGNHTYYQWGRKDPFMAAGTGGNGTTKEWWHYNASGVLTSSTDNPPVLNSDDTNDGHRPPPPGPNGEQYDIYREFTKNILNLLIQKPDTWNNPPCTPKKVNGVIIDGQWDSLDATYSNLWTNRIKTVYDPSPTGYQVSPWQTFGVTVNGTGTNANDIFNVIPGKMLQNYRVDLFDFYTTQQKLISAGYPETGYRDYDAKAQILKYGEGYIWYGKNEKNNTSYFFMYTLINPNYEDKENNAIGTGTSVQPLWWGGPPTDGCAVRPTKIIEYKL